MMMGMKWNGLKILAITLLFFAAFAAKAQDIHFSQYNAAPLLLNPAFTGVNGCDYRFAANYRTQWSGIAPFRTIAASYDMAIAKKKYKSKGNYGGVGVSFFSDKAGDSELSTNQVNLNVSYTIMLNRKGTQTLTTGLYGGIGNRNINLAKLTFDSQFGANGYDPNRPTGENIATNNLWYADAGAGFLWNYNVNKKSNVYLGLATFHVTQPNLSFLKDVNEELFIKVTFHGGAHFKIANQFYLLPSFMVLKQGPHSQLNIGSLVRWGKSVTPKDNTSVYFGGYYRMKDAVVFATRVDFNGLSLGFSYDVNISKLTIATRGNGGPELSLLYTGCFSNKKNQTRFCPVL
jgi:type IX secretion system PorP/SprF family membrane protein